MRKNWKSPHPTIECTFFSFLSHRLVVIVKRIFSSSIEKYSTRTFTRACQLYEISSFSFALSESLTFAFEKEKEKNRSDFSHSSTIDSFVFSSSSSSFGSNSHWIRECDCPYSLCFSSSSSPPPLRLLTPSNRFTSFNFLKRSLHSNRLNKSFPRSISFNMINRRISSRSPNECKLIFFVLFINIVVNTE